MKRLLIPTDFSKCAEYAVDFGIKIAKVINGEIYLLHVLELPSATTTFATTGEWGTHDIGTEADVQYMIGLLRETRKKMKSILAKPELKNVKVFDNIEVGGVSQKISAAARKYDVDLIVMGSHGSSGLKELFVGSNAENVVKTSHRPVLTVKKEFEKETIRKIIFASDLSEEASAIFSAVKGFAKYFDAEVKPLKVVTLEEAGRTETVPSEANKFIKEHNLKKDDLRYYNDDSIESGILHFAEETNADIIAIGSHGRSGLSNFFAGSLSEHLVNHACTPILTINFYGREKFTAKLRKSELSQAA